MIKKWRMCEDKSIDCIVPGLYVGDKNAAHDLELISRLKLTHIITAELIPLPRLISSSFPHLAILHLPIADLSDSDLLTNLEKTTKFIREGIENGGAVLVHCYHGVSRSAAIATAYVMKSQRIDFDSAMSKMVKARPSICPNDGFQMQLRLYAKMNYKLEPSCAQFKYYKLTLIRNQVSKTDILPPEVKKQNEHLSLDEKTAAENIRSRGSLFRCKKCRIILFNQCNVLPHSKGVSATWETLVDLDVDDPLLDPMKKNFSLCSSGVFIEPLKWMENCQKLKSGKLNCFKCQNKLGNFSWTDSVMCSCGSKFSPAFLINLNRVDKCTMLKELEANL